MRRVKRLIYYLLLNILVSTAVTLLVLRWWDSRTTPSNNLSTPVVIRLTSEPQVSPKLEADSLAETTLPSPSQPDPEVPQPTATIEVITYLVQSGDTLGTIAAAYQVSIADLLAVNQLEDPDQLFIGQTIYIPTAPLPTWAPPSPTPSPSPTWTATLAPTVGLLLTATPTPIWQPAGIEIVTVIGTGDIDIERVVLERTGSGELALAGWQLQDQDNNVYIFPQLTLYQGGAVNVHSRLGQDSVVDLYWNLTIPVWQSGETVTLVDALGMVHATFIIP